MKYASVAQLVEQLIRNEQVNGSSPFGSSRKKTLNSSHCNGFSVFLFLSYCIQFFKVCGFWSLFGHYFMFSDLIQTAFRKESGCSESS